MQARISFYDSLFAEPDKAEFLQFFDQGFDTAFFDPETVGWLDPGVLRSINS